VQFLVNQGHQLVGSARLAFTPCLQQARDFVMWGRFHPTASARLAQ
jgi:hypothetical protein